MAEMTTWFPERAFGKQEQGKRDELRESRNVVPLQTQQNAVSYLRSILKDTYGARALIGQDASGKSTIIGRFRSLLRRDVAIAQVNAAGLTSEQLLASILDQFGYSAELDSADDLLRMLNVFALQQTRAVQAPLIIVENLEQMRPTALRSLCLLAGLIYQGQYALRLVITGTKDARRLLDLSSMKPVADRIEAVYEVEPLTPHETTLFLHGRLAGCDVMQPDSILPLDVCDRMHELSGGNPGELCRIARKTLQQAVAFPATLVDVEKSYKKAKQSKRVPKLIVNLNGKVVAEYEVVDKKMTIGRSSLADIQIHDERISKFHAMLLIPDGDAVRDVEPAFASAQVLDHHQRWQSAATGPPVYVASSEPATEPDHAHAPATGDTQLPVQGGDTLSEIAHAISVTKANISTAQVMVALYEANPHAFGASMNTLYEGAVLDVPGDGVLSARSDDAATREVQRQVAAWGHDPPSRSLDGQNRIAHTIASVGLPAVENYLLWHWESPH